MLHGVCVRVGHAEVVEKAPREQTDRPAAAAPDSTNAWTDMVAGRLGGVLSCLGSAAVRYFGRREAVRT